MRSRTRTGLLSSPTKCVIRNIQKPQPNLRALVTPAPFIVKPYAGLYNPYNYGCSILCNHPTDGDVRKMIQNAKDNMGNEGRSFIYPDDLAAIRAELEQIQIVGGDDKLEHVPEELFRRYTETDSRPLTPAPTLISAQTRASAARRCVTPDPIHTSQIREKTLLILDLRRSHSQETLSFYASTLPTEIPLLKVTQMETQPLTPQPKKKINLSTRIKVLRAADTNKILDTPEIITSIAKEEILPDDEEIVKRRGKKRRRKKANREISSVSTYRQSADPETMVAGVTADSQNQSTRTSLIPNPETLQDIAKAKLLNASNYLNIDSFLDVDILRQLRRELTVEQVESEFNVERQCALQEALKTLPANGERMDCEELVQLQSELNIVSIDNEMLLKLPRNFSRANVRFELPMDSRIFSTLTPLEYLKNYVEIGTINKCLYNHIFNMYKNEQHVRPRKMGGKHLMNALAMVMGREFNEHQIQFLHSLVKLDDQLEYEFKTFCGIAAMCERIMAKDFTPKLKDKKCDPCNQIETVDFELLEYRLIDKPVDENLVKLLTLIKYS